MFRLTYKYPAADQVEKLEARAKTPGAPCQKVMLAWIDCMKQAKTSYVQEGQDVEESSNWAYHHLKTCLHPFIDARECLVEKQVELVRQAKKYMSDEEWEEYQKRMRYMAHKTTGVDKWDKIWNPELDYTEYFKKYREHMVTVFKMEEEYKEELAKTGDIADPNKYRKPILKYWQENQVFVDGKANP